MNFKIIRFYIKVCRMIKVKPSFKGLHEFEKYYCWECENNGRFTMDESSN